MAQSPWRIKSARNLLIARAVSGAGSWIQVAAAGWFVLQQTGSATAVGILAAVSFAPAVVGSPVGGWMADKYDIRKLGSLLCALQAISPFIIALLVWDNEMPIPLLYLLIFLGAIPGALASPVTGILPPMAVPAELKSAVIADAAVSYNLARTIGPLIGSGLVALISVGGAFLANSLSFLYNAWVIRRAELISEPPSKSAIKTTSYYKDVRRGWEFAVARTALIGALAFFGLVAPIQQMLPALAATHGEDIFHLGLLLSSIAVGGIIANPFIRRALDRGWTNHFLVDLGMIISGPILLLLGASYLVGVDLFLLIVLGGAWECLWVASQSAIQIRLPPDITGRMLGLFFSVITLGTALGSIILGQLFEVAGSRSSLFVVGILVCAYGVFGLFRIRGHLRALPDDPLETTKDIGP